MRAPRPPLVAAVLALLSAVSLAGTASNQLCGAAGQGAGCIGTVQGTSSPGASLQVDPSAVNSALAGAAGTILGNALGAGSSGPRYQHQEVKPVVTDDDDIPAKTDVGDAQDIIRMFREPHPKPGPTRPAPASDKQVDATVKELQPFVKHRRSKLVRKLEGCKSGCGCPNEDRDGFVCTPTCSGTCYDYGGKDADPAGSGIDCSGLIAQENPCFWYKDCGHGANGPELDCQDKNGKPCKGRGTEQELTMLRQRDLDDKDKATDLNAGDVVFFNEADGHVGHVVQVTSEPACNDKGCMMQIIQAPQSGRPVEATTIIIDKNGRTNKVVPNPKGAWTVVNTDLVMEAGGTPPPGPRTGGGKSK
ncbi:MAG TPA: hypothetical protein VN915_12020 [Elusimicrobiota bacterium]|nr:hypothetical protein [Elusimicrobiota bacterium]